MLFWSLPAVIYEAEKSIKRWVFFCAEIGLLSYVFSVATENFRFQMLVEIKVQFWSYYRFLESLQSHGSAEDLQCLWIWIEILGC